VSVCAILNVRGRRPLSSGVRRHLHMDHAPNSKVPAMLDGAVVLRTARLFPVSHTGNTRHEVAGEPVEAASRLAIARYPDQSGFYLFYCDAAWSVLTDTWHESVEAAVAQAEFEYTGSSNAWIATNAVQHLVRADA